MATLEDKILGNKLENYCSSSEDEDDDEDQSDCDEPKPSKSQEPAPELPPANDWDGTSSNTGPKGVLKDWQRFKQLEAESRNEQEKERLELMKKLSLSCMSSNEEDEYKKQKEAQDELDELLNDDFLLHYQKQRMQEMLAQSGRLPRFGKLSSLSSSGEFLEAIDCENKSVVVIVHIFEDRIPACSVMNGCLISLSQEYPTVKFCKLVSSLAGMSRQFKIRGVPALLVYKGGQMIANFVRITDELGHDFYANDVENLLLEHGILPDKSFIPAIVKHQNVAEDDSDVSLD